MTGMRHVARLAEGWGLIPFRRRRREDGFARCGPESGICWDDGAPALSEARSTRATWARSKVRVRAGNCFPRFVGGRRTLPEGQRRTRRASPKHRPTHGPRGPAPDGAAGRSALRKDGPGPVHVRLPAPQAAGGVALGHRALDSRVLRVTANPGGRGRWAEPDCRMSNVRHSNTITYATPKGRGCVLRRAGGASGRVPPRVLIIGTNEPVHLLSRNTCRD